MFITANNPQCLDDALIRSCRVDLKIELGFADKHQSENMFNTFLPEQKDKFKEFYDNIKNKKYTTAMLQELLFFNQSYFCHHCKNRIVNPDDCEWEDIGLCCQCGKELNEENRSVLLTNQGMEIIENL